MNYTNLLLIGTLLLFFSCRNDPANKEKNTQENPKIALVEQNLLPDRILENDTIVAYSLESAMKESKVPGVSIAVVHNGKLDWAKGYGFANTNTGTKVDTTTMFQAASISKPIAALAILKLLEEGKVHLDSNVNNYLTSWKVADTKFTTTEKVTLRRLLTHSAGTTVHGFPGYKPTDTFPSTQEVLEGKGNSAAVVVDTIPGGKMKYSGGGYTIVQKVIEDLTKGSFEAYMDTEILQPLGMLHSTFSQPLPSSYHKSASAAYDNTGSLIEGVWHHYPEKAAAGLWTTPSDLARYIIAMQEIKAGKKDGLLLPATVSEMLTLGKFEHGLGPALTEEEGKNLFVHGGKNAGFTNVFVAYVNEGKGLVVMTNADNGGALLGAVEKAISKVYDWGLSEPKVISPILLSANYLQQFTGTYTYVEQVPSVGGDYVANVRVENDQLVIYDVPEKKDYHFVATDSLDFLDIENGDRVSFKIKDNIPILWWNNSFQFKKD